MAVSSNSNSIIITWDKYPNVTSYNIYYSNTSDFANPTKISTASSPYIYNIIDTNKNSFFRITAIINGEEKRIGGDILSIYHDGNRDNYVTSIDYIYSFYKTNNSQTPSAYYPTSTTTELPIGPLEIKIINRTNIQYYVSIDAHIWSYSLPQGDGSTIVEDTWAHMGGPPSTTGGSSYTIKTRICYDPLVGITTEYLGTTFNYFTSNTVYTNDNPLPGRYMVYVSMTGDYGKVIYTDLEIYTSGKLRQITTSPSSCNFDACTAYNTSFNLGGSTKDKKLKSIEIKPASATIYAYPVTSASHQQQYIAIGTFNDNTTAVITNSVRWHVWDLPIASISKGAIAFPSSTSGTYTAGTTSIDAASTTAGTEMIISNIAELNVRCFEYTNYLQVEPSWKDDLYAYHKKRGPRVLNLTDTAIQPSVQISDGTIGSSGCLMVSIAMGLSAVGISINPSELNQEMIKPTRPGASQAVYYSSKNFADIQALKDFSNGAITSTNKDATLGDVSTALDNCDIVIAQIPYKNERTDCGHWAIVKSYNGNIYHAYDPTFGDRDLLPKQFCGQVWIGTLKK